MAKIFIGRRYDVEKHFVVKSVADKGTHHTKRNFFVAEVLSRPLFRLAISAECLGGHKVRHRGPDLSALRLRNEDGALFLG